MNVQGRFNEIKRNLLQLQTLDPTGKVLFGAEHHLYRLNPPASEALVARFEALHQIQLPDDYHNFLLSVGNGGAGPWYGLWELAIVDDTSLQTAHTEKLFEADEKHPLFGKVLRFAFSSIPKYSAPAWKPENLKLLEASGYAQFKETALEIGTQGCNISILLVVSGPHRGEIWSVWAEEFFGFSYISLKETGLSADGVQPFESDGEGTLQFLDWYECWLDVGLSNAALL